MELTGTNTVIDTLFTRLQQMGYGDVTLNVWHDVRLYVNIKGQEPFAYKLDDKGKVTSKHMLEKTLFLNATKLTPFVNKHIEEIRGAFDGAGYVKRRQYSETKLKKS